jgi:hypothetical protein
MSEQTEIETPEPVDALAPTEATAIVEALPPVETVQPIGSLESVESMETVTCPECGRTTAIAGHRRDAASFCPACDFPLFWAPTRVVLDGDGRAADDSLRRLPGTAGRATVASLTCPHCAEQNPISATVCVRCGRSLHPEPVSVAPAAAPVPEPVVVEPEPESRAWDWVWVAALIAALIIVGVVVWIGSD